MNKTLDDTTTITIPEYGARTLGESQINESVDIPYLNKACFTRNSQNPPYKITPLRDNKVQIENTSYSGVIQLENSRIYFSTKVKTNLFYMLSFLREFFLGEPVSFFPRVLFSVGG